MLITIQGDTIPNWQPLNPTVEMRIFANDAFVTDEGVLIQPGPLFYQAVECTPNLTLKTLAYPTFTIEATTNGTPNNQTYSFLFYSGPGVNGRPINGGQFVGFQNLPVPFAPTTTTLAALEISAGQFFPPGWSIDEALISALQAQQSSVTFPANNPTPSVFNRENFITANTQTTNYTNFLNPYNGQRIEILVNDIFTSIFGTQFNQGTVVGLRFDLGQWYFTGFQTN